MRYPGGISAEEAQIRNFGIAAHTDFEAFTFLHQDAPGLQLQAADGVWVDAPVPALGAHASQSCPACIWSSAVARLADVEPPVVQTDECTVILGDMLEVWTNGHLKATRARALPVVSSCCGL